MVLQQIQEKSNTAQAPAQEKQVREETPVSSPELPQLTLVDSAEEQEQVNDVLPQESKQGDSLQKENVEEGDLIQPPDFSDKDERLIPEESPIDNRQDAVSEGDLLTREPEIQLGTPELQVDEPANDHFVGTPEKIPELDVKNEGLQQEPESLNPEPPSEVPSVAEDFTSQERKNSCPRCSLKFKPNVKQCPICRVNLLTEGVDENVKSPDLEEVPAPLEPITQEQPPSLEVPVGANGGNGLEIVECGQPSKTSHSAIRVPLTLKVNGTPEEFKVNLAIDFGNGFLK